MAEKKKIGRPPEPVPQAVADAVVEWLYEGKSLLSFCEQDGMPTIRTVHRWVEKDETFASNFARAREAGAATRFDRAGNIVSAATPETVHVAKLQAEHEYKAAACFCPRVFGTNRQQVEHSGGVAINVVTGIDREAE